MKRIPGVFQIGLALLLPLMMTACSEPETHIAKINLINDLGSQVRLELCKDDLHCQSISELWPAKTMAANESRSFVVSTEETTVFKVSYSSDGKPGVRCLRVRRDKSLKIPVDLPLSTAAGC
jgi:hypothetical protein